MFVVHLLQHKWDERNPYPSLGLVAARMGVSLRQVQRYEASLVKKGYLSVYARMSHDRGQLSNEYNFTPLIERILALDAQTSAKGKQDTSTHDRVRAAKTLEVMQQGSEEANDNRTDSQRIKATPLTPMSSPPVTPMSSEEDSPQTDTIIDQIDKKKKEEAKHKGQETSHHSASFDHATLSNARRAVKRVPPSTTRQNAPIQKPTTRAPQRELKSLKELLSTGMVMPASTLPADVLASRKKPRVRGEKGDKRRTIGKRGALLQETPTASYSTLQNQIAPQAASPMPSARIAETVKRISREFGDSRVEANTRQLMGLYHRSGMSESAFEDWLYTIRSELKERRGSIKKPMAYLYTTLKNRLRL